MNAAGQILVEFLLLMAIFILVVAAVVRKIPFTFDSATPYLAGKIEQRLQTGKGFGQGPVWQPPLKVKTGVSDQ
jgi:hypothetical protein